MPKFLRTRQKARWLKKEMTRFNSIRPHRRSVQVRRRSWFLRSWNQIYLQYFSSTACIFLSNTCYFGFNGPCGNSGLDRSHICCFQSTADDFIKWGAQSLSLCHFSAAVGRTDTLIAARVLLARLRLDPRQIDIFRTAVAIRKLRCNLVQVALWLVNWFWKLRQLKRS